MEHKEYLRKVPGARTAVLCIHGILGTPRHFDRFIERIPPEFGVYNILLEGHGRDVKAFAAASMKKWRTQVERVVEDLIKEHETLIILAHSMGTLFAIEQAVRRPDRISGIFLLASPLKVFLKPRMAVNALKVQSGRIDPEDILAVATRDACGTQQSKYLWQYIGWIPRFLELFRQIRYTRQILPRLKTPCIAFQSRQDEMVAISSVKILKPHGQVHVLENSGHFYYAPEDAKLLLSTFREFLDRWKTA